MIKTTVHEGSYLFYPLEMNLAFQLLAEAVAAGSLEKKFILDGEVQANLVFPRTCYYYWMLVCETFNIQLTIVIWH